MFGLSGVLILYGSSALWDAGIFKIAGVSLNKSGMF